MATRKLAVEITGDSRGGVGAMKQIGSAGDGLGSKMAGVGKKVGQAFKVIGLAAVAGAAVIGKALFDSVGAARESAKINAETARVIASTGAKSWGASADSVGKYVTALSNLTGVDDEVIQSGANLLLTFTNVQNKVGKGNDVFNQTVGLANDMSVALGTDMKSASMQLGKALNDPTKGITALSRAGVSFTKKQKDQIKILQATGDVLGAQKIILAEVKKEFGGAAAAAATPMDRLKVTIGNLQEQVGGYLIPIIDKAARFLADKLPGALDVAGRFFSRLGGIVSPILGEIRGGIIAFAAAWKYNDGEVTSSGFPGFMEKLAYKVRQVVAAFQKAWPGIRASVLSVVEALKRAVGVVAGWVKVAIQVIKHNPKPALAALAAVLGTVAIAWAATALAQAAAMLPWIAAAVAIAALAAGLVYAYQKVEWFRKAVDATGRWLRDVLWPALQAVASYLIGTVVPAIASFTVELWQKLQPALLAIGRFIRDDLIPALQAAAQWFGENVLPVIKSVASFLAETLVTNLGLARDAIGWLVDKGKTLWTLFSTYLLPVIQSVNETLGSAFSTAFGIARDSVGWVVDRIQDVIDIVDTAVKKVTGLFDTVRGAAKLDILGIVGDRLKGFARGGRPPAGVPYVVGEKGPEVRVDGPGTVIPNNKINAAVPNGSVSGAMAGGNVYVTVQVAGSVRADRDLAATIRSELTKAAKNRPGQGRFIATSGLGPTL